MKRARRVARAPLVAQLAVVDQRQEAAPPRRILAAAEFSRRVERAEGEGHVAVAEHGEQLAAPLVLEQHRLEVAVVVLAHAGLALALILAGVTRLLGRCRQVAANQQSRRVLPAADVAVDVPGWLPEATSGERTGAPHEDSGALDVGVVLACRRRSGVEFVVRRSIVVEQRADLRELRCRLGGIDLTARTRVLVHLLHEDDVGPLRQQRNVSASFFLSHLLPGSR